MVELESIKNLFQQALVIAATIKRRYTQSGGGDDYSIETIVYTYS